MERIAIITARGGSKRIPRKNIKDFFGKPIIAYSIEAALSSGLFDEVMVSTDDQEIADIAREYGATVPFLRSAKNADDYASTLDVILEVLNDYEANDMVFDYGCCIYPTAPFVSKGMLSKAYDELVEKKFSTLFPVLPFSFPIQRAMKLDKEKRIEMFQPEHLTTRSQDLEAAYHDAGQFYWFDVDCLKKERKLWTDNSGVVVLHELEAQDIDNLEDWKVAEFKYKLRLKSSKNGTGHET